MNGSATREGASYLTIYVRDFYLFNCACISSGGQAVVYLALPLTDRHESCSCFVSLINNSVTILPYTPDG